MLKFLTPQPYRVYQRNLIGSAGQTGISVGTSTLGDANVHFSGQARAGDDLEFLVRGQAPPFMKIRSLRVRPGRAGFFKFDVKLPAGGWYVASLKRGAETVVSGPFGVGEVFLVSGQSYVGNFSDARFSVRDRHGRAAAYSHLRRVWRVGHDPQPCMDFADDGATYRQFVNEKHSQEFARQRFDGGSVWPLVGDLLVDILNLPIGFANVSFGGARLEQWNPQNGILYEALLGSAKSLGGVRAVLWAQGESDILNDTNIADWLADLQNLKKALAADLGNTPVWLIAKSTLHPCAYSKPALEDAMRMAIDEMWRNDPDVFPGPDTDRLHGDENRGKVGSACHFTATGQKRAALLWFHAIFSYLESNHP